MTIFIQIVLWVIAALISTGLGWCTAAAVFWLYTAPMKGHDFFVTSALFAGFYFFGLLLWELSNSIKHRFANLAIDRRIDEEDLTFLKERVAHLEMTSQNYKRKPDVLDED